jgi:hypothetical protein
MALLPSILLVAFAGYGSAIETVSTSSDACDAAKPGCMMASGQAMLQVHHGETTGLEEEETTGFEEEMPEEVAEQIYLAEQEEKVLAFLNVESHDESQHESQYDDSSVPEICSSSSAFNGTKPFGPGKCSFSKQLKQSECPRSSGCHWSRWFKACLCYREHGCRQLGGTWFQPTCATVSAVWERAALDKANEAGSCDGIQTNGTNPYEGGGSATGRPGRPQPLSKAIDMVARVCCTNFPATFCDPDAKLMKPCVNDEDFDGSKVLSGWCRMPKETPKPDKCRKASCRAWQRGSRYGCYCQGETACLQVGGSYNKHTCADSSKHWYLQSKAMKQAKDAGTCDNVKLGWGSDLESFVKREATRCCTSFPKTMCNPEGKVPRFLLAAGGESCTQFCTKQGKQCDPKALKEAASSPRECRRIIRSLGKRVSRGGQYRDDNSGCTYHPGQTGWYQVMRRSGDPECDAVNSGSARQRICSCE